MQGTYIPTYGAGQAQQAAMQSQGNVMGAANNQFNSEIQRQQQNAEYMRDLQNRTAAQQGSIVNAARNAEAARNLATNAQATLNNMFATAGDRMNQATANTQAALNQVGATIAGAFR